MFKSVEYAGFDGQPELRTLAERANDLLPNEIQGLRESVGVEWEAHAGPAAGVELTLALELPGGSGRATRLIPVADFGDDDTLSNRIRGVWDRALGDYLEKRKPAWDALIREPLEV